MPAGDGQHQRVRTPRGRLTECRERRIFPVSRGPLAPVRRHVSHAGRVVAAACLGEAVDPLALLRTSDWSRIAPLATLWVIAANGIVLGLILLLAGLRQVSLRTSGRARRWAAVRLGAANILFVCVAFAALQDAGALDRSRGDTVVRRVGAAERLRAGGAGGASPDFAPGGSTTPARRRRRSRGILVCPSCTCASSTRTRKWW
jgi:hypothetical protein